MRSLSPITVTSLLFLAQVLLPKGTALCDRERPGPNEAGRIMVLMYHGIGPKERKWVRSIDSFKNDLRTLYEKGYRPVPLRHVVNNQIDINAGYTPVVLTFDDGREDNFRINEEEGEPKVDPDSAVGILEQFQKEHSDFGMAATFFVNGETPFGQPEWVEYKLNYLVSHGMDVGNHTAAHDNFSSNRYSNPKTLQRAIGKQAKFLMGKLSSKANYQVNTLALCHGARPKDRRLLKYLKAGSYKDFAYENIAILNVGSGPAHSPYTTKFNPFSIPRIRAGEIATEGLGISDWIRYFDRHGSRKYISDGDPKTVTVPKDLIELVDKENLGEAELVARDP